MPNGACSKLRIAFDFVWIGVDYWLTIYPRVARELATWRRCAAAIPDPELRAQALEALSEKRKHAEGAAAFAVLSPRGTRQNVIRFLVAFQVMYDYLDSISEVSEADPLLDTLQLHTALTDALMPGVVTSSPYALHPQDDDGGYLARLVATCRMSCSALPAFPVVASTVQSAAQLARQSQGFNHALPTAGASFLADVVVPWASAEAGEQHDLAWWEVVGATASSLAILVLVAAAANPALERSERDAIHAVYMPWAGAVLALVDSLVDQDHDDAHDTHSLVARYASSADVAERVSTFADRALGLTRRTTAPERHALIVAAMIALFASTREARSPRARHAIQAVLQVAGPRMALPLAALRLRQRVRSRRRRDRESWSSPFASRSPDAGDAEQ